MRGHSFAYEGKCTGCKQDLSGCSFCRARQFQAAGCSCPVEPIHIARSLRWRRATAPAPAPAPEQSKPLEQPKRKAETEASPTSPAVEP